MEGPDLDSAHPHGLPGSACAGWGALSKTSLGLGLFLCRRVCLASLSGCCKTDESIHMQIFFKLDIALKHSYVVINLETKGHYLKK